jgi:hypothetical protein
MRSSEGQNLEERARCWRRRKNEREEVEERLVKGYGRCPSTHEGCQPHMP